jgi:hypothetical protein
MAPPTAGRTACSHAGTAIASDADVQPIQEHPMTTKIFAGIAGVAIACAAGWAQAQTAGGTSSAAPPDTAAPPAGQTTKKHRATTKAIPPDALGGTVVTPSGAAVPTTPDPLQVKNARDGTPLPSHAKRRASGADGGGAMK